MKTFNDLDFVQHPLGDGVWARMSFDNGYGVSVIRTFFSFGGQEGLFELAVTSGGRLTYGTPVTDDVEGFLTEQDVTNLMAKVQELPAQEAA